MAQNDLSAPAELSAVVDELLNSLSNKFAGVSSEIFAKSMIVLLRAISLDANCRYSGRDVATSR